jgi:hypothetical protein
VPLESGLLSLEKFLPTCFLCRWYLRFCTKASAGYIFPFFRFITSPSRSRVLTSSKSFSGPGPRSSRIQPKRICAG